MFASLIFQIVYGRQVKSLDDEFVLLVEKALAGANECATPGANWVEFMPFLRMIPSWLPGGRTQRLIAEYKPAVESMVQSPFEAVKRRLVSQL